MATTLSKLFEFILPKGKTKSGGVSQQPSQSGTIG